MSETSKKRIPAPDDERERLIRRLIRHRIENYPALPAESNPSAAEIEELPTFLLMSTADSAILLIVEQFHQLREGGMTESDAITAINKLQAHALSLTGQSLPILTRPTTLFGYIRHFIDTQFSHNSPICDAAIQDAIQTVERHYNRNLSC